MTTFSERLSELRNEKQLSQEKFAYELGISKNSVYYYENDKRVPDANTIIKISEYFHVTTDYLLGLDDCKTHDNEVIYKKLSLTDESIQALIDNNNVYNDFIKDHPEQALDTVISVPKSNAQMINGAYAKFINNVLTSGGTDLMLAYSKMLLVVSDNEFLTMDLDGNISYTPANIDDYGYYVYLCDKEFTKFLDKQIEGFSKCPEDSDNGNDNKA